MTETEPFDPLWRQLDAASWTCAQCGEAHGGVFDLGWGKPDVFPGGEDLRRNAELDLGGNFLSEDFCVLGGEHFFVRGVLELPILRSGGNRFGFGVWSSLSRKNFEIYVASFDSGDQGGLGPWFGWFSNALKGYPETLSLKCQVHPQADRKRPLFELEPTEHPLALEQRYGISLDRLLDIYAINGHDFRNGRSA